VIVDQDAHPPHHLPTQSRHADLEQLGTTDKHSCHHGLHLHTRLLIAAAMVIRLSPKASRPFPAAWPRAGTYHERLGAGCRDLWRHVQAKLPG
jgi:hypothetical protein